MTKLEMIKQLEVLYDDIEQSGKPQEFLDALDLAMIVLSYSPFSVE